jgi:hypothetical protein
MINLVKYYSSLIQQTGHRIVKAFGYGAVTADIAMPFGEDSCPVKGMDAIYATTDSDEQPVIIGYINTNQIAGPGEKRQFSLKAITVGGKITYQIAFYTHLKNDGTYEIGGNTKHMVRYEDLNLGLIETKNDINAELVKIQTAISSLGGTYLRSNVDMDISAAKIDEIKTL